MTFISKSTILYALIFLIQCTDSNVVDNNDTVSLVSDIMNHEWELVYMKSDRVSNDNDRTYLNFTLTFESDSTFYGKACNYFGGGFSAKDGGEFSTKGMWSTLMGCGNNSELIYFELLASANVFVIHTETVEFNTRSAKKLIIRKDMNNFLEFTHQ